MSAERTGPKVRKCKLCLSTSNKCHSPSLLSAVGLKWCVVHAGCTEWIINNTFQRDYKTNTVSDLLISRYRGVSRKSLGGCLNAMSSSLRRL